jgi:Flp pilus assembly pilin Flp
MMSPNTLRLVHDERGATIVEFALDAPVLAA